MLPVINARLLYGGYKRTRFGDVRNFVPLIFWMSFARFLQCLGNGCLISDVHLDNWSCSGCHGFAIGTEVPECPANPQKERLCNHVSRSVCLSVCMLVCLFTNRITQ